MEEINYNHLAKILAKKIVKSSKVEDELIYEDDEYYVEFDYHFEPNSEYDDDFIFYICNSDVCIEIGNTELSDEEFDSSILENNISSELEVLLGISKQYNKPKKQSIKKFNTDKDD